MCLENTIISLFVPLDRSMLVKISNNYFIITKTTTVAVGVGSASRLLPKWSLITNFLQFLYSLAVNELSSKYTVTKICDRGH